MFPIKGKPVASSPQISIAILFLFPVHGCFCSIRPGFEAFGHNGKKGEHKKVSVNNLILTGVNVTLARIWGTERGPWSQVLNCVFGLGATVGAVVAEPFVAQGSQRPVVNVGQVFSFLCAFVYLLLKE